MGLALEIYRFWFGDLSPEGPVPPERLTFWFGGDSTTDDAIRESFAETVEQAAVGAYDDWAGDATGTLSLILLLDQFPRNIFRKTPRAFASDAKALVTSRAGIAAGIDRDMHVAERAFLYLPLEHAEDLDIQEQSVACFESPRWTRAPRRAAFVASPRPMSRRRSTVGVRRDTRFPSPSA